MAGRQPNFETVADIEREREAADRIERRWRVRLVGLPKTRKVDYQAFRGDQLVAVLEIKGAKKKADAHPTALVAIDKLNAIVAMAYRLGVPGFLFVNWTDRLGWVALPCQFERRISGRRDRGDAGDIEPCAFIPLGLFKWIEDK